MESTTELANSFLTGQLTTLAATDLQKAWHISAVLLSLRRPARPIELVVRCTLFHTTSELIEFLCSIPNSPIFLTPSYFVTFSSIGYLAMKEFLENSNVNLDFLPRFRFEIGFKTYFRKRKRARLEDDECLLEPKRRGISENFYAQGDELVIRNGCAETYFSDGNLGRGIIVQSPEPPMVAFDGHPLQEAMFRSSLFINSCNELSKFGIGSSANSDEREAPFFMKRTEVSDSSSTGCQVVSLDHLRYQSVWPTISQSGKMSLAYPFQKMDQYSTQPHPVLSIKAQMNETILAERICFSGPSNVELEEQMEHPEEQVETAVHPHETVVEGPKVMESNQEVPCRKFSENLVFDLAGDRFIEDKQLENVVRGCEQMMPSTDAAKGKEPVSNQANLITNSLSPDPFQLGKSLGKSKFDQRKLSQSIHPTSTTSKNVNTTCSLLKQLQTKRDKKSIPPKQHLRYNFDQELSVKEQDTADKIGKNSFTSSRDQQGQRVLPNFESFVVEEEEGSGGYGTVYRARRKTDGVTFAIKSPHASANRNHVHNELKMLERFGGKNFVIRYEGSIKNGSSDCLVLEHVQHDRPEVLKKYIDVCELQWYGYCMFRALAGLHKQGIVHRDVKPGNFLFNRKACKGYLIDFNLAMDLNHKYGTTGKTKEGQDLRYEHVGRSCTKPLPPTNSKKFLTSQDIKETHHGHGKALKPLAVSKDMRKKIGKYNPHSELGTKSIIKSQGADGSGITSAKDATSTKTPSAEKFREPLPCQGRKELINLVQEALQGANREAVNVPVSKRKRVAAPPEKVDHKFVYLTPMPLQSAGGVIGGAGSLKSKGDGKNKREGPCVGTKGFRAPEVLFRSQHQGPKVDIWSAGVTLLYLMIGRAPFVGDPDQNAKEIAKLRGSEELWEVAKLHNRESSFPGELFDIKFLASMKLREWCKVNSRRPDFVELIPRSLFDLVDKCLAVNPRVRISAEEALRHEFFSPCHEALRKHRMLRQGGVSLDSGSFLPTQEGGGGGHSQSQTCGQVS